MIERITQSFMKTMREYLAGEECGIIVKTQYVDGVLVDRQSDAMAQGSYFEFLLSGALPKSGLIPQPVYMLGPMKRKAAKDLTVDDMTVDYRRIHANVAYLKVYLKMMGLKIVETGKRYVKGRFEGTIDLVVECERTITFENGVTWKKGDRLVLDVKYSGLLNDKWNKLGWMWSNIQKEYHGTQAKQYHYVSKGLPFHFLVISNTNKEEESDNDGKVFPPPDIKLFHVPVDEHMIEAHIAEGNHLLEQLKAQNELGLIPRPSLVKCNQCPLKDTCDSKHTYPHVENVDLTIY